MVGYSHAGQHAYTASLGVVIPYVATAFHVSYALVGVVLAVAAIASSVLQGVASFVRSVTTRTLLVAQNLGGAIGAAIGAAAPVFWVFGLGRFVQAATGWPQHPVGSAYLTNRHPSHRGSVLSWHVTGGNVGTLVAPLVTTSIIAVAGWHWALGAVALILLSTVFVARFGIAPAKPASAPDEPTTTRERLRTALEELKVLLRRREAAVILAVGMIAAGGQGIGILSVYVPSYLHTGLHLKALALGAVLTVLYVGAVVGPVLTGHLADRLGHRAMLLANYALGASALVGFALVGRGLVVLALVGLATGLFSYSELPLRQTLFSDYSEGTAARSAFGIFFTVSQTVGALWVAIIGILITTVGFHGAFFAMAGTFVAAGVLIALGTRARPRRDERPVST
jgi:MFS family permease